MADTFDREIFIKRRLEKLVEKTWREKGAGVQHDMIIFFIFISLSLSLRSSSRSKITDKKISRLWTTLISTLIVQSHGPTGGRGGRGWVKRIDGAELTAEFRRIFPEVGGSSFTLDHTKALVESAAVPRFLV